MTITIASNIMIVFLFIEGVLPAQGTFEQQPEIVVAVAATATSAIAAVIFPVVVFPLIPVAEQLNLG